MHPQSAHCNQWNTEYSSFPLLQQVSSDVRREKSWYLLEKNSQFCQTRSNRPGKLYWTPKLGKRIWLCVFDITYCMFIQAVPDKWHYRTNLTALSHKKDPSYIKIHSKTTTFTELLHSILSHFKFWGLTETPDRQQTTNKQAKTMTQPTSTV